MLPGLSRTSDDEYDSTMTLLLPLKLFDFFRSSKVGLVPLLLLLNIGSSSIGQEFKGGRDDRLAVGKELGGGSGRGEELVWLLVGIVRGTFLVVGREAGVGPVVLRLQLGWRTGLPLILATAATAGGGVPA